MIHSNELVRYLYLLMAAMTSEAQVGAGRGQIRPLKVGKDVSPKHHVSPPRNPPPPYFSRPF